jgi:hypothetical protein|tara:strand:+ start:24 stop:500 length:477 start_codon:yes stop_codon:yes gene_type:complete
MYLIPFLIGLSASAFLFFKVKETVLSKDGVGIAKYLMSLGYSKANSSGIAGNIFVESSYNPLAVGDNGTSFGLAQWHKTRWQRLNAWAKENNKDPNTFQGQLDYLDWELKNTEKKAYQKLIEAKTPYQSAYNFAKYFERPAVISPKRMQVAESIYAKL